MTPSFISSLNVLKSSAAKLRMNFVWSLFDGRFRALAVEKTRVKTRVTTGLENIAANVATTVDVMRLFG